MKFLSRYLSVRRAFRINDALPEESVARWQWQRGGWLLVDRVTGRVSPAGLPWFRSFSMASWYRDYAAYCGLGDDGKKTYAVVAQLSRRKPVLKKLLPNVLKDDSAQELDILPAPQWQRNPVRVSFVPDGGDKQTFAIRGTAVDLVNDLEEEE